MRTKNLRFGSLHMWGGETFLMQQIPQPLNHLVNILVARMDNSDAMDFYMRFLNVLNADNDLTKVEHKLKLWVMVDPIVGIIKRGNDEEKEVIEYTAEFLMRLISGEQISKKEQWEVMRRTYDGWSKQERFVPMSAVHWSVLPKPTSLMWVAVAVGEWNIIEYKRIGDKLISLLKEV